MPRAGPKRVQRYSLEFKRAAVRLSEIPGLEVQAIAEALVIHPAMLSRWRRETRQGILSGAAGSPHKNPPPVREIRRLQELERTHRLLQEEHELLKKAVRFCSARRQTSLPSSTASARRSR
jgi:transposase